MTSIVTAALVLVVEAGFILSLAMAPGPAEVAAAAGRAQVVARHAPASPAAPATRS